MSLCRSCLKEVLWCKTPSGKTMPVDPEPVPDGNLILVDGTAYPILAGEDLQDRPRHKSHFATCVFASQHRKKKA